MKRDPKVIAGQLVLPEAKHSLSEYLVTNMYRLIPVLPQNRDALQQFASNLIVACNELDHTKIADRSRSTVLVACFNAARIGLIPGAILGLCYFVPRKGRCCLDIGYQGYIDLATSNQYLKSLYAEVVLDDEIESEKFSFGVRDAKPFVDHFPDPLRDLSNDNVRKECRGSYCIYETAKGGVSYRFLTRDQLDAALRPVDSDRHYSRVHYYEWARKTAIRRAAKDWKKTRELSWAVHMDDMLEVSGNQPLLGELPAEDGEPEDFSLSQIETVEGEIVETETNEEESDAYQETASP